MAELAPHCIIMVRMLPGAIVAGASSGIGAASARRLIAEGWAVAVIGRRQERLEELRALAPERVWPVAADLTVEADIEAAILQLIRHRALWDALIVTAGDFIVLPMEQTTPAEFERLWRLLVMSKFLLTRACLPLLVANGPVRQPPAAVVHVASLAAHRDFPDETAYISAMHGVVGLARAQDVELRDRGVRVAVLSPGLVRTELTQRGDVFTELDLKRALPPEAMAESINYLVNTIRQGGYIPEIFHIPDWLR